MLCPVLPLQLRMSLGPTLEETMGSVGPRLQVFEVLELALLPLQRGCPPRRRCGRSAGVRLGPQSQRDRKRGSVLAARPGTPPPSPFPSPSCENQGRKVRRA